MTEASDRRARDLQGQARAALAPHGLLCLGWLALEETDEGSGRALLIGNVGPSLWPAFQSSAEAGDGAPDPMNRWTRAALAPLARELGAQVRFPFDRPFFPFQRYARLATGMEPSPLGLAIHPEYGLWVALRGLLVWADETFALPPRRPTYRPCDRCPDKPCLDTCPVDAFDGASYAVERCRTHVRGPDTGACAGRGCAARRACPVGAGFAYEEAQQRFHMKAFLG